MPVVGWLRLANCLGLVYWIGKGLFCALLVGCVGWVGSYAFLIAFLLGDTGRWVGIYWFGWYGWLG